ncbi:MAG: hypothetical protein MUF06_10055 [Pirellulaceae bacterium]|jgi:hypothetical protein|nr:hypothetical protein [Pirellulaceae bacterium]
MANSDEFANHAGIEKEEITVAAVFGLQQESMARRTTYIRKDAGVGTNPQIA